MDILKEILRNLNLTDLLSVADANMTLRFAAMEVFRSKFEDKRVILMYKRVLFNHNPYMEVGEYIVVNNYYDGFRLIRNYGPLLREIEIRMLDTKAWKIEVNTLRSHFTALEITTDYMQGYCSDALRKMKMHNILNYYLTRLPKPFRSVKTLHITGKINLTSVTTLFPNLRQLTVRYATNTEYKFFNAKFPNLEYLEMYSTVLDPHDEKLILIGFMNKINTLLRANKQLIKLKLPFINHENFLKKIRECVPKLEELSFANIHNNFSTESPIVRFEHMKVLRLYSLGTNIRKVAPFHCTKLEELYVNHLLGIPNGFYGFLSKHKTLRKLTIHSFFPSLIIPSKLASVLPNLAEFDAQYVRFTPNEVFLYVRNLKKLSTFKFSFGTDSEYNEIAEYFENEWECDKTTEYVKRFDATINICILQRQTDYLDDSLQI